MNIILNERIYAEKVLERGYIGDKPTETLGILAKYFYHLGLSKEDIYNNLDEFMTKYFYNYNPDKWTNTLESQVNRTEQYMIKEIDYISITESELTTIKNINSNVLEKLAFSLLCLSKFYNMVNPTNNDWANVEDKVLFKLANIQVNIEKQCLYINDLKRIGLIEYSRVIDNINTNVLYINDESPIVLKIYEFRDLGLEYLYWKGENYVRCRDCGKLIKPNKQNNNTYCNSCKGYLPIDTKIIKCINCGIEFKIDGYIKNKKRCDNCQKDHIKKYDRDRKRIKQ